MSSKGSQLPQLISFIRQRIGFSVDWIERDFTWQRDMLRLALSPPFADFEWACVRGSAMAHVLGIRTVGATPLSLAAQFEAAGFWIERRRVIDAAVPELSANYAIAELLGEGSAVVYLCVLGTQDQWKVLLDFTLQRHAAQSPATLDRPPPPKRRPRDR